MMANISVSIGWTDIRQMTELPGCVKIGSWQRGIRCR